MKRESSKFVAGMAVCLVVGGLFLSGCSSKKATSDEGLARQGASQTTVAQNSTKANLGAASSGNAR